MAKRLPDYSFRVMTYNIRAGLGADSDWKRLRHLSADSLAPIAACIAAAAPDLVALQEVVQLDRGSTVLDQARILAETLGLHYSFGLVTPIADGRWGNAILSRYPILSATTHPIPFAPFDDPRSLLEVRLRFEQGSLTFFSAHLSYRPEETARQVRSVVDKLYPALEEGPVVLAGDLNVSADSPALAPLHTILRDAFSLVGIAPEDHRRHSFPSGERRARALDHIFVSSTVQVQRCQVWLDLTGASDHNPVLADITLLP